MTNNISIYVKQGIVRFSQAIVGMILFDFPPLLQIRNSIYRILFFRANTSSACCEDEAERRTCPLGIPRKFLRGSSFNTGSGLFIGNSCYFIQADFVYKSSNLVKLKIGKNVVVNHHVEIDYSGGVTIKDDVWISQNALIETHSHVVSYAPKIKWPIKRSSLLIEKDG